MEWGDYQLHLPMTFATVSWARPPRDGWYGFEWANLRRLGTQQGIYILWYPETDKHSFQVAYVGQGIIRARIQHHRGNWSRIRDRIIPKRLRLTWTVVPCRRCRDGIERYLVEVLQPEVGEVWPQALPIRVNLPDW